MVAQKNEKPDSDSSGGREKTKNSKVYTIAQYQPELFSENEYQISIKSKTLKKVKKNKAIADISANIHHDERSPNYDSIPKNERIMPKQSTSPKSNKAVNPCESIGSTLQDARKKLNISIEEVAVQTRIKVDYIRSLEADDFQNLPTAPIYTKSYISTLSRFYKIDSHPLTTKFTLDLSEQELLISDDDKDKGQPSKEEIEPNDEAEKEKINGEGRPPSLLVNKKNIVFLAIALVVLVICFLFLRNNNVGGADPKLIENIQITEEDLEQFLPSEELLFQEIPIPKETESQ